METTSSTYPAINLSGNARAIIGNVYGTDSEFLSYAARAQYKGSLLQRLRKETNCIGDCLLVVSSEFSVLVLKDYEDVKSIIGKFRRYENKIEKFAKQIAVRQTIFQHTLRSLLIPYTDADVADQMLNDAHHTLWSDVKFLHYLSDRLGTTLNAIQNVLELISSDLEAISEFGRKCADIRYADSTAKLSLSIKNAHDKLRNRFYHLVHEERLADHVNSLKENTNDFRILLQQCAPPAERNHVSAPSAQTKLRIGRYKRVQEAAANLYHSFGLACTKHTKHQAHLRLQADCGNPSQVQFTLLLKQIGYLTKSSLLAGEPPPLRLTVESQVTGTISNTSASRMTSDILASISSCRKRVREADREEAEPNTLITRSRKSVGFTRTPLFPPVSSSYSDEDLPNFCRRSNFCTHVQHLVNQGCRQGHPLGYLDSQGSKHLIYLSSQMQTIAVGSELNQHMMNFNQFYQTHSRQISKREVTSLAKQLATAVLQYHTTPWLEESWNSNHVLVESHTKSQSSYQNVSTSYLPYETYLDVSILNPNEIQNTPISKRSRTLIRNWTLYSLGVMMLELAYKRSIQEMRALGDVDEHNEHNTNYYTADRLQKNVSMEMGLDFAEIIRKCIQCDFGHGADLSITKLQEGFYEDVVQKLEDIETKFKNFGL